MTNNGGPAGASRGTTAKKLFLGGAKYSWIAMLALWLVYAMNANTRQIFYLLQPQFVNEFNITPGTAGIAAAIYSLALSAIAIPAASWSDRRGQGWARKFTEVPVALGYMFFAILTGIAAITQAFWQVLIWQSLKSVFNGAGEAIEVTAISEWWPFERRGFAQGLHHTAYPWGTLLGGFGVSIILGVFGPENWRYVFLIIPWLTIPFLVFYWFVSRPGPYRSMVEDVEEAEFTAPEITDETSEPAAPGATKRTLLDPNVIVVAAGGALGIGIYFGISFWLPLYLNFIAGYNPAAVAAYSVIFTITGGVGQILWGSVSDKLGRKYTLIVCFLWLALALFLFQFSSISLAWVVAVQLFAGMATNGIFPVQYAFASDSAERGARGAANGLMMFAQGLGGVSPLVIGGLIGLGGGFESVDGYLYSLYFMAGLMLFAALITALFSRETIGIFKERDRALISRRAENT